MVGSKITTIYDPLKPLWNAAFKTVMTDGWIDGRKESWWRNERTLTCWHSTSVGVDLHGIIPWLETHGHLLRSLISTACPRIRVPACPSYMYTHFEWDGVHRGLCVDACTFIQMHTWSVTTSQCDTSRVHIDNNGSHMNGPHSNGSHINGFTSNNGLHINGSHINGSHINGSHSNGSRTNGSNINGSQINGSHINGSQISRSDINGSHINDSHINGSHSNGSRTNGSPIAMVHNFQNVIWN